MTSIQVNSSDLAQAKRLLDPARFSRLLRSGMEEALAYMKGLVQGKTPVDTGLLRGSIFTEIRGTMLDFHGVVAPGPAVKEYASVMELGRRPGARMPPVDAIVRWVIRKQIASGGSARSVAFLIARSIGRKGIRGRHMFEEAAREGAATAVRIIENRFRKG